MREELNISRDELSVNDILAEYRAAEADRSAPISPDREALRPRREEEGVRIYQPRKGRENSRILSEPPARELPEEPETALPEQPQAEAPAPLPAVSGKLREGLDLVAGFFKGLGKGGKAPEPAPEETPARELPSFEELIWGKKTGPVRITEEEDAPAPSVPDWRETLRSKAPEARPARTPRPAPAPAPAPKPAPDDFELEIPAEELSGMSVNAILAEYWSGFSEEDSVPEETPPAPRRERPAPEPPRQQKGLEEALRKARRIVEPPRRERPAPTTEPEPAPIPEPVPAPAPAPVEAAHSFSVDEILLDFWAEQTEESAPAEPAPRSRREAARRREEADPVPPTGAAPSAAAEPRPAVRRRERTEQPLNGPADPPATEKEAPRPFEPAPQEGGPPRKARAESPADGFRFLRRRREKAPAPEKQSRPVPPPPPAEPTIPEPAIPVPPIPAPVPVPPPPPVPAATASPREITDEDVEFGAMSVDEILAEYKDILAAIPAAASAIGTERSAERTASAGAPKGRLSRMEEEARSLRDLIREGGEISAPEPAPAPKIEPAPAPKIEPAPAPKIEPAPAPKIEPAPAPKIEPAPAVSDAEWGASLRRLLGQEPGPAPRPAPMPEKPEEAAVLRPAPRRGYVAPSEEIDPRFNLSGERKISMVFGDKELDLSADENYVPPRTSEQSVTHWTAGEEEAPAPAPEKRSLLRRRKKNPPEAPAPEGETDGTAASGYDDLRLDAYAPPRDYENEDADDPNAFPSFGQYLSGLASGLLVRLLGVRSHRADEGGTMEDESEDLGPEVSPAAASRYYGSFVTSLRMRLRIALALMVILAWITLGLPVTGALRSVQVASAMALAIQLVILLLGLDVVTGASVNMARGRFGADSLAVLSCVLTSLDALSVSLGVLGTPHMPLCLVSSASFLGVLLSSMVSARGLRKALRVPAIGKRCYAVTAETQVKGLGLTLLKSQRPPKGFVRRTEEAGPDETAFNRLAPLLALLCLPLSLAVALAKHAFADFLFILTALLCPAVPLAALLCFALPFLLGSLRIFHSGAAIAGWSGISEVGRSDNLIVTDRDLFPEGSVEIDTVRVFAEVQPETIISYAGTMICASGSDLAPCFAELMEKNGCPMRRVENYEYMTGGGMKGVIDGSIILCGGVDLMRLMNVRVPYRLVGKTTVLLAVDGILCGIFNMKYEGQPQVRKALVGLIRSNRHPIFAIRDFLVTPEMLASSFDVATDGYDFPPYTERFAISEATPGADSKIAAVVCREGLGPLVHMADTGRSMFVAVRLNLLITVLAAVLGVLTVFVRLLSVGTVGSGFLLLFLLLWALPVALISLFLKF